MLMRNSKVKDRPQRFQDEKAQHFEIVITFEERVFDIVVEGNISTSIYQLIIAYYYPSLWWLVYGGKIEVLVAFCFLELL